MVWEWHSFHIALSVQVVSGSTVAGRTTEGHSPCGITLSQCVQFRLELASSELVAGLASLALCDPPEQITRGRTQTTRDPTRCLRPSKCSRRVVAKGLANVATLAVYCSFLASSC